MPKDDTITIDLDEDTRRRLDALARTLGRDRDTVLRTLLGDLLHLEAAWPERIREGLAAADRGEFATDDEIAAARRVWRGG